MIKIRTSGFKSKSLFADVSLGIFDGLDNALWCYAFATVIFAGTLVAFLAYVSRFFQPVQEMSRLYTMMQSAMAGGEQVIRLLDTKPDVQDLPDAAVMPPITGDIDFGGVSFAYRPDLPPVLHNIDLTIPAGWRLRSLTRGA